MLDCGSEPYHVHLEVAGEDHPAVVLELNGHRAAVRSAFALARDTAVCVHIDWASGAHTTLPGRVQAVAPHGPRHHLAHLELTGIEGDWASFLALVGPAALAS
jgi:hypothetical protein